MGLPLWNDTESLPLCSYLLCERWGCDVKVQNLSCVSIVKKNNTSDNIE